MSKQAATAIAQSFPAGTGLEDASVAVLESLGAKPAQARRIKAAFGLVRVCDRACRERGARVRHPGEAAKQIVHAIEQAVGTKNQEYFVVAMFDARQKVIDMYGTGVGTLSEVAVHPRELFAPAIQARAHSVIIAHNHPSNDPEPSEADYELTRRMVEAGQLLGIPVLDSLVVTPSGDYVSMAASGTFPPK